MLSIIKRQKWIRNLVFSDIGRNSMQLLELLIGGVDLGDPLLENYCHHSIVVNFVETGYGLKILHISRIMRLTNQFLAITEMQPIYSTVGY